MPQNVCWPGSVSASFSRGVPASFTPAGIEAIGLVNAKPYALIISKLTTSKQEQAVLCADPHTQATFILFKLGVYQDGFFNGSIRVFFNAEHIAIFDIILKPAQGKGAAINAVGQIVCP